MRRALLVGNRDTFKQSVRVLRYVRGPISLRPALNGHSQGMPDGALPQVPDCRSSMPQSAAVIQAAQRNDVQELQRLLAEVHSCRALSTPNAPTCLSPAVLPAGSAAGALSEEALKPEHGSGGARELCVPEAALG